MNVDELTPPITLCSNVTQGSLRMKDAGPESFMDF